MALSARRDSCRGFHGPFCTVEAGCRGGHHSSRSGSVRVRLGTYLPVGRNNREEREHQSITLVGHRLETQAPQSLYVGRAAAGVGVGTRDDAQGSGTLT